MTSPSPASEAVPVATSPSQAQRVLLTFLRQTKTMSVERAIKLQDAAPDRVGQLFSQERLYRWDLDRFMRHYNFTDGSILTTSGSGRAWQATTSFPDGKSANLSKVYTRKDKDL